MKNRFNLSLIIVFLMGAFIQLPSYGQKNDNVEQKVEAILQKMTLQEKVNLCHAQSKFSIPGVARLGVPELWMSDGPHGIRAEIEWDSWNHAGWTNDSCTAFPALTCLAATFNPEMSYKYGQAIGAEARYRRKDVLLGPGVNIYRTPLNGRNFEYMGEDPFLASVMVVPYIKGVQENKVAACVKHYALNNQEVLRSTINVKVSDRALHEIYLPAFKAAVEEGDVWSIMGAYNKYQGEYCCENKTLNNDILKGDWKFDGVVISDWAAAHNTTKSALYGLDIEMGTGTDGLTSNVKNSYDYYYLAKPFLEKIQNGEIDEEVVNDKARRILRLMMRTTMSANRPFGEKGSKRHFDVAREVAEEGIVLLKNKDHFFPLDTTKNIKIAVIGENATRQMTIGGGSSELKTIHEISPLAGIKSKFPKATIEYTLGYSSGPSIYDHITHPKENQDSLYREAIRVAKRADVVIFVGGLNKNYQQDCENGDRTTYDLPFGQNALINKIVEVNPNTGVLLVSGNAVAMPWVSKVKSVAQAWYLGSEGGNAIANILSGKVNPSGKLPITFAKKLEDVGAHSFGKIGYPGDGKEVDYKEGILVGYRWFDTHRIDPLFSFGHGLSYTTFEMNNLHADQTSYTKDDTIVVTGEIQNTGSRQGAEVIQIYVHDVKSQVVKAENELKGFQKIKLQPNESKSFKIAIPVGSLAYYDAENKSWKVEDGIYKLRIGNGSRSIAKTIKIRVAP
ncbi:MAG: beta-glucosidase family protein [Prolixibacteraceae bacterium]